MRFVLITGLSGAGKSQAIHCFEDLDYFCVDNLPPTFIPKIAELCEQSEGKIKRIALVCDIRGREFFKDLFEALSTLEGVGFDYEILFLEADQEVLVRRFKETRRRHPLSRDSGVMAAIKQEKKELEAIRDKSDVIIDTSTLFPLDLKEKITKLFAEGEEGDVLISLVSFGYKHGIPVDADLVFDVRFLPNPYYVHDLRSLSGEDNAVKLYVWKWFISHQFLVKLMDILHFLIPCYMKEGKKQLVIAVGCTGGRHRSVVIADEIANNLKSDLYRVIVEHRDIEKA